MKNCAVVLDFEQSKILVTLDFPHLSRDGFRIKSTAEWREDTKKRVVQSVPEFKIRNCERNIKTIVCISVCVCVNVRFVAYNTFLPTVIKRFYFYKNKTFSNFLNLWNNSKAKQQNWFQLKCRAGRLKITFVMFLHGSRNIAIRWKQSRKLFGNCKKSIPLTECCDDLETSLQFMDYFFPSLRECLNEWKKLNMNAIFCKGWITSYLIAITCA